MSENTILETLKALWPDATEDEYDSLMWITPYPFKPAHDIKLSLTEMREKWGSSITDAIIGEMKEFDAEFDRFRESQKHQPD